MIHRRAFLVGLTASTTIAISGKHASAEGAWGEIIEWVVEVVKVLPASVEDIYRVLLNLRTHYRLLVDDRTRLQNVRRELSDPSSEKQVQTKLATWLTRYDSFINEKSRPGESAEDFAARKDREHAALAKDWKELRDAATDALKTIKLVGTELESIQPGAMSSEQWRRYKELVGDEKEFTMFLDTDMPTDPTVLARLREIQEQLAKVVQTIDQYAGELDDEIKRAG